MMTTTTARPWLNKRLSARREEIAKEIANELAYIARPQTPAESIARGGLKLVALHTEDRVVSELLVAAQVTPSNHELAAAFTYRLASLFVAVAGRPEAELLTSFVADLASFVRGILEEGRE